LCFNNLNGKNLFKLKHLTILFLNHLAYLAALRDDILKFRAKPQGTQSTQRLKVKTVGYMMFENQVKVLRDYLRNKK